MSSKQQDAAPDSTAARVALWRALRQRLIELGFGIPDWLHFVPVDFEAGPSWRDALAAAEVRPGLEMAAKGARASGTPFVSFFTPAEIVALAREAGFAEARHVSAAELAQRYFAGRTDGLRPPNNAEELLVATT